VVNFTPRPLYPGERNPVPIKWEVRWAPEPVWTFYRKQKCGPPARIALQIEKCKWHRQFVTGSLNVTLKLVKRVDVYVEKNGGNFNIQQYLDIRRFEFRRFALSSVFNYNHVSKFRRLLSLFRRISSPLRAILFLSSFSLST
jgi:hypothetical protein